MTGKPTEVMSDSALATANWNRYEYAKRRGHDTYCATARKCEDFYLGGGRQWSAEDLEVLAEAGRPALEFNQIKHKLNTAIGYQIQNRMDISFRPRGRGADEDLASVLSKVAMQVADNTKLHWLETQVFSDGMIQQRGYFDLRISYRDSMLGEITIEDLDPMDVMPDPDAKSYDPDKWQDVTVTRWLTYDDIEELYGTVARQKAEAEQSDDADFGDDEEEGEARSKFGGDTGGVDRMDTSTMTDGTRRVRVIDRQFWRMEKTKVAISMTGDIRPIGHLDDDQIAALKGVVVADRRIRRVRWLITTRSAVLHDDWSPFEHFTVVPFFPFFRRGQTVGLVDDAIGPQELLNKSMSQYLHTVNTSANSGWISWANTIANMRDEDLSDRGAETGLHIVLKKDTPNHQVPQKIQPNQAPTGIDRMIERAGAMLSEATGVNDAMSGDPGKEVSGLAIQAKQFAAQQGLAVPLDNLARTRNMMGSRILKLIQSFYDTPRIIRITDKAPNGKPTTTELQVNVPDETGGVLNDLTIGEYDVVVAEVPMQVTFENGQFEQALNMRDKGVRIPDKSIIMHSNLADKHDILEQMEGEAPPVDPTLEAKAKLMGAQADLATANVTRIQNEAVNRAVEAQFSAIQTAGAIATNPQVSGLGDALLRSAGYVDRDSSPIIPQAAAALQAGGGLGDFPQNTNPSTPVNPANPAVGLNAGIETKQFEGAA